ncbi:MAG: iron-containing alcohol dehydrogenase [Janthinobacterium lividum]
MTIGHRWQRAASGWQGEQRPLASLHQYTLQERMVFGRPLAETLSTELARLGKQRVFIITNASLADSAALSTLRRTLGEKDCGTFAGIRAHAPREDVLAGAAAARAAGADLLLALGGGSVIDATKVMLLCLRHSYTEPAQLDAHAGAPWDTSAHQPPDAAQWVRMLAVPTTFSAAEYTAVGGATESRTKAKQAFGNQMMMPQVVINDPAMTATAPLNLLLSTGMKAVDHAVERLTSKHANLYSDLVSETALRMLAQGLKALRHDADQPGLRAELQYGVFLSMAGMASGVRGGLSHGIAHVLGALADVPHGHTSCILLPAVMRWIADAIPERQARICAATGYVGNDAAAALTALIEELGMPSRISQTAVRYEDLDLIAARTLHDPLIVNCPRKVENAAQVRAILESAW